MRFDLPTLTMAGLLAAAVPATADGPAAPAVPSASGIQVSGNGDGRVYKITVSATDNCDNVTTQVLEVRVPHDQNPKSPGQTNGNDPDGPCEAIDSGGDFDATVAN